MPRQTYPMLENTRAIITIVRDMLPISNGVGCDAQTIANVVLYVLSILVRVLVQYSHVDGDETKAGEPTPGQSRPC